MLRFVRLASTRPMGVLVTALVIAVIGFTAQRDLALNLFPDFQSPTVLVEINSEGRPAEEMEQLYGRKIEQRLFTVQGLKSIEQTARNGQIISRVTFRWGTDPDVALIDVSRAVSPIEADPRVEQVKVQQFDPNELPVITLGLTDKTSDTELWALRQIALRQIAPTLEKLPGVAQARVTGGRIKEVRIAPDFQKVNAYGISIEQISERVHARNKNFNLGTVKDGDQIVMVRALAQYDSLHDIEETVLKYVPNEFDHFTTIKLGHVADVTLVDEEVENLVLVNGKEGIGLAIYKEYSANTVAVSELVRQAMTQLQNNLPGLHVALISDQAAIIQDAIFDVEQSALLGGCLAILVLLLFLRSATSIFIIAFAVPVSLLATFFIMQLAGQSLNLMTLTGLALGLGLLVDNAIVVVEAIFKFRSQGKDKIDAAVEGAGAVIGPITSSTLTTCVVFLPVLFIDGFAARLMSGISFSVITSLLVSLLVAIFFIPALCVWLLPKEANKIRHANTAWLENILAKLLRRPGYTVLCAVALVCVALISLLRLGSDLLPTTDPRTLNARIITDPNNAVHSTQQVVKNVETLLQTLAGDQYISSLADIGKQQSNDRVIEEQLSAQNTAHLQVRLGPGDQTAQKLAQAATLALTDLHGVTVQWNYSVSELSSSLGSNSDQIIVELSSYVLDDLRTSSAQLKAQLESSALFWHVNTSFEGAPDELHITLKTASANTLGVSLETIESIIKPVLQGLETSVMYFGDEARTINIKLPRVSADELAELTFRTQDGKLLTLGSVATITQKQGAKEIYRKDQKRVARIIATFPQHVSSVEAREYVALLLTNTSFPYGLTATLANETQQRDDTIRELTWAAAIAVLLVFMVLAGSIESFVQPVTILSSVFISLVGVALVLVPIGQPVGIMAMLGLVVLFGIAVNDAILYVQAARNLISQGLEKEQALIQAAAQRLRPIIMTSATTVLALLPLAIGASDAAQLRAPLAYTIISGVIASTLASLLVIPCIYSLLERDKQPNTVNTAAEGTL